MNANPPGLEQVVKSPSFGARVIEVLLWLAIVGTLAAIAIPAFSPSSHPPAANPNIISEWLGLPLWLYLLAKLKKFRRAWAYALLGIVVVLLVTVGAGIARGLRERAMAEDLISSVERLDPQAGGQLRAVKNDKVAFKQILAPVLNRAIERAPDSEVLAFNNARLQLISPASGTIVDRCVAAARGSGSDSSQMSKEEQTSMARAVGRLVDAAALQSSPQAAMDEEKAQAMLDAIYSTVDPSGTLNDVEKTAALLDDDMCQ